MKEYIPPERVFVCPYCKKELVAYNKYDDQWTCENPDCVFGKHAEEMNYVVGNPEMWGCVKQLIATTNKVISLCKIKKD